MKRRRKKKPAKPKPRSGDDVWCDETRTKCAKAMVEWLKGSVNVKRPIQTLTLAELECMAEAATATFIVEASRKVIAEPDDVESMALMWIMG